MTRTTTIYAAILAEHGNADERYPRPLTCDVCCARPRKPVTNDMMFWNTGELWYVTEADPLPEGWQVIEDVTYHYKMTYCPSCFEERGEELSY